MTDSSTVTVVGAGLAGSEAAWQLAQAGISVRLLEMRPQTPTAAHKTGDCAELVCSNSFRSDDSETNAVGVLHEEMRRADSLVMRCAAAHSVPAGSALAVDREGFSQAVTQALEAHPRISRRSVTVTRLPPVEEGPAIVATGPLTHEGLAKDIRRVTGEDALAFFDAIAPIVHVDTVDMSIAWRQSRYDKSGPDGSGADYVNCPLDAEQYDAFIAELQAAEPMPFRDWERETPYFEGCLPIEEMARRGPQTLRYGPMKPVGLTDAHRPDRKPHAVVQLRQDNALGTLFNMVGFQTKLKYGEQIRIFRKIPGLEQAEFARLGGIHRNTFLNSPKLLDPTLRLRGQEHLRFAGQMTGCEGYVESAAIGGLAARFLIAELAGRALELPPDTTAHGALLAHITSGHLGGSGSFQPMNVNFGLFRPLDAEAIAASGRKGKVRGREKKMLMSRRALADFDAWLAATRLSRAA